MLRSYGLIFKKRGALTAAPILALCASGMVAADALAQTLSVEEIVVTARKREESLQSSPVSISAFSNETLESRQITSVGDLGKFTPNMSLEAGANLSGSSASVTTFIRGIGQTDFNLTIDPGVGLYVDGVYVSRSVGALLDILDIQSVQILRGPQGTLFGKNTIGGAVLITSNRPSEKLEGSIDVATGRYDRFDARGMLNIPVSERLRLRASGSLQTRDGYVERLTDGEHMGNQNSLAGRLLAEYDATDDLRFTLSFDGNRRREQGKPVVLLATNEGILPQGFPNAGGFFSFVYNKLAAAPFCGVVGEPSPLDNPMCFNSQWLTGDKYKTWASGDNSSDLDLWGTSFTVDWSVSGMAVKSITSYRDLDSTFLMDNDATPIPLASTFNDYSQHQFSQELQLSGQAVNDRLTWLAGVYYLKEKGTDRNILSFSIADFLSGGKVDNDSYAGFAQLSYELTQDLSLTLGGRYTYEKKRFLPDQYIMVDRTGGELLMLSRCFIASPPTIPPNPFCAADPILNPDGDRILPYLERDATAKEFTPSITLDYQMTAEVLLYVSYSKGFKSGGFTQRVFPPEPETPAFDPEYVNSYEIGAKTQWLENRLRLNGAVFYTDYSDLQIIVNEGIAPKVRNAGKARIKGFELEAEAVLTDWLRASGGIGYTDAYYLEVPATAAPVTVDSKLPNAPKWTSTVGVSADVFKTDYGMLSLRSDWAYKGGHFKDAVNSIDLYQSSVSLFNASATFATLDAGWSVTGGVTNITNKKYLLSGYQDLDNTSTVIGSFSRPREWFLRLKYEFGQN